MSQVFAQQLGLKIWKTNIGAQKMDNITLETYEIVVFIFSILDMDSRERLFEKSFLFANIHPNVVFGIFFQIINNTDIDFQGQNLQ